MANPSLQLTTDGSDFLFEKESRDDPGQATTVMYPVLSSLLLLLDSGLDSLFSFCLTSLAVLALAGFCLAGAAGSQITGVPLAHFAQCGFICPHLLERLSATLNGTLAGGCEPILRTAN